MPFCRVGCPPCSLSLLLWKRKKNLFANYFFVKNIFSPEEYWTDALRMPFDALPVRCHSYIWNEKNNSRRYKKLIFLSSSIERMPSGYPPCSLSLLMWKRKRDFKEYLSNSTDALQMQKSLNFPGASPLDTANALDTPCGARSSSP